MNIEKIVSNFFDKKRSESLQDRAYNSANPNTHASSHMHRSTTTNPNHTHNNHNISSSSSNFPNNPHHLPINPNKCHQPEQYTFKPQIHQIPKSLYKVTTKTQCSRQDIIQRLYNNPKLAQNRNSRTIKKLSKQQKQFRQNCTFQPQTNINSKRILKTQCTGVGVAGNGIGLGIQQDPFQRLYMDGLNKKKLSQSLNYLYNEQNKQNYPFQPQTNYKNILNSQTCPSKPIYERISQILKQKKQKMKKLQSDLIQSQQYTSKPMINQISQKIVSNKEQFKKNILDRISGYIQEKKKKQEVQAVQYQKNIMKQCTFKPQINYTIQVSTNFLARQQQHIKKIHQKQSHSLTHFQQNNFQPQINKISQILMREEREAQTLDQKINRLTYNHQNIKKQKIQQIQRQIYQQCTFVPEINTISKCLAAEHVSHKCNHTPNQQVYNFKPKINKLSEQLCNKMRIKRSESCSQTYRQSKKQHINQLKMQKQYKQLYQCTFKPKINNNRQPPTNSSTNINQVKGFQSFKKKIQKINQIKQQQKQLKQKLFNKQKYYRNRKSTTPMEFKLSQGYNMKEAVKQEVNEKFEKQCTFKPKIISFR